MTELERLINTETVKYTLDMIEQRGFHTEEDNLIFIHNLIKSKNLLAYLSPAFKKYNMLLSAESISELSIYIVATQAPSYLAPVPNEIVPYLKDLCFLNPTIDSKLEVIQKIINSFNVLKNCIYPFDDTGQFLAIIQQMQDFQIEIQQQYLDSLTPKAGSKVGSTIRKI